MNCGYSKSIASIGILGTRIDAVQIPDIVYYMEDWIVKDKHHNYIVVANVDTIMTSRFNVSVQKAVNESSLAIPDGFPLVLMGRLWGHPLKKRAYGPDLMLEFLKVSEKKGYSHFFYGSTEETLNKLKENMIARFPGISIAGSYAPPFRPLTPEEDNSVIETINGASPDVLWVGIGCPKQELWMYDHRERLKIPVMAGVGAAFDFLAGVKLQAPRWMQNNGFEWLFRLITEPKRLWRRYLINNFLFIYYVGIDSILRIFASRRIKSVSKSSL